MKASRLTSQSDAISAQVTQVGELQRSVDVLERGHSHTQSLLEGCNKKYERVITSFI